MYELVVMLWQQTKEEVKKKELTTEDIDMGFDITLTKHKGQVIDLLHAHLLGLYFLVVTFSQCVHDDSSFFVDCVHHYFINYYSRSSFIQYLHIFPANIWCGQTPELWNSCISGANTHLTTPQPVLCTDLLSTPFLCCHVCQYALRKLYHESPRLLGVLYTSPTCGPCRTLKPILNKVRPLSFVS